jgi:hypothetical protein
MELGRKYTNGLLAVILLVFVLNCWPMVSDLLVGGVHDEMMYFEGARSLAEDGTYSILSLPGEPAQIKYPVLFSMLLSTVWLAEPDFPENLIWAQSLMVFFGVLLLLATYNFARSLGCSRAGAIAITAICSLHSLTITISTILMTDVVFGGLLLSSMVCADRYLQATAENSGRHHLMVRLLLSVVAMILLRTLGVPVALGIAACGAYRRNFRLSLAVLAAALLAEGAWLSWTISHRSDWAYSAGSSDIVRTTSTYYSSYIQFWFASVPDWQTLFALVKMNAVLVLREPGAMFLQLPAGLNTVLSLAISICVSVVICIGMFRDARREPRVVHFVFPLYAFVVLTWNFPIISRLLFPFLPFFLWGLVREATRFTKLLKEGWLDRSQPTNRVIVPVFALAIVSSSLLVAYQYLRVIPSQGDVGRETRIIASRQKVEAYDWIKLNTGTDDRFVTYGDGLFFLHTGRQAIIPAAPLTTWIYRGDIELLRDAYTNLESVAKEIDARYWVVSAHDAEMISDVAADQIAKTLAGTPVAFKSSDGTVEIHDLSDWYALGR